MRTRVATIEAVRSDLLAKPRDKRSYGPTRSRSMFGLQREKSRPDRIGVEPQLRRITSYLLRS